MILDALNQLVIDFVSSSGYLGLFFAMFIEGIITPIPSEAIVPFAGYLASTGQLSIILVVLAATIGATCGSTVSYCLARWVGRPFVLRIGKYIGINENTIGKADRWFEKHGTRGALFGPMFPGIRSIIAYPAGLTKMSLKKYVPYFFMGSLVWNSTLTIAGYYLGDGWIEFWKSTANFDVIVLAVLVVGIVGFLAYRHFNKKSAAPEPKE
jgi:membrane protein DedA with SNARE-associated domain